MTPKNSSGSLPNLSNCFLRGFSSSTHRWTGAWVFPWNHSPKKCVCEQGGNGHLVIVLGTIIKLANKKLKIQSNYQWKEGVIYVKEKEGEQWLVLKLVSEGQLMFFLFKYWEKRGMIHSSWLHHWRHCLLNVNIGPETRAVKFPLVIKSE